MFKREKEFILQYMNLTDLPLNWYRKYWVGYAPNIPMRVGIVKIEEQEVLVYPGDYLVEYKGRLYYYPKSVYESRANKELVGIRRR